ncbi:phospholipid-binding protein MlaC [Pseudomonadota bacterium]
MKFVRVLAFNLTLLIVSLSSAQAGPPPDVLVKDTTDKVISELSAKREELKKDQKKLFAMVDEIVFPHFDFERMSKSVLGRRYWPKASEGQKKEFMTQFQTLLVRTYAIALFDYKGQEIKYKPMRMNPDQPTVVIRTEIVQDSGSPIPMDYRLVKSSTSDWKVYDVAINGSSLVKTYQTSYRRIIRDKGMQALIDLLVEKNSQTKKL